MNNHSFDLAKQGYINLLLAHQKHSKEPGDSAEMIRSRRLFLNRGFYDPISLGLNQVLAASVASVGRGDKISILDAGCGEGFYLQKCKEYLERSKTGIHESNAYEYYGLDISKFAIRQATQRDHNITWVVASSADIPFGDACMDRLVSIFAPVPFQEFSRVLKPDGMLILVTPGPNHLKSLREIIYRVVREREQAPVLAGEQAQFSLTKTTRVVEQMELDNSEDIMNLLAMTPYFWNIDLSSKSRIEALSQLSLEIDVNISLFAHRHD